MGRQNQGEQQCRGGGVFPSSVFAIKLHVPRRNALFRCVRHNVGLDGMRLEKTKASGKNV
jgi:hypothetical protein